MQDEGLVEASTVLFFVRRSRSSPCVEPHTQRFLESLTMLSWELFLELGQRDPALCAVLSQLP
jgi:hypothetical protein